MKSVMRGVVLLSVLVGGSALACSCRKIGDVLPRDGSTNVPTNVVLRALYNFAPAAEDFSLSASDGTAVALTLREGPGLRMWSLEPATKLEPLTTYTLTIINESSQSFTTGEFEDHAAPTKPSIDNVAYTHSPAFGTCGESKAWALTVSGGDDENTPQDDVILLAHSTGSTDPTQAIGATRRGVPVFGTGLCSTSFTPPAGSPFPLAVQAMDLAGNVSEVSSTYSTRGCNAAPGGALVVLLLALINRRRRA